jgi:hypothetical protein
MLPSAEIPVLIALIEHEHTDGQTCEDEVSPEGDPHFDGRRFLVPTKARATDDDAVGQGPTEHDGEEEA